MAEDAKRQETGGDFLVLIIGSVGAESICLADVAKPSQGKVPADLTLASAFKLLFSMNVGLS